MNLHDMFEKYNDDFLKFDLVQNKLSNRPDLHAFLLLDSLQPKTIDMVSTAEHGQIWLDIDCDKLSVIITDEQVKELSSCGVFYEAEFDCLCMFV